MADEVKDGQEGTAPDEAEVAAAKAKKKKLLILSVGAVVVGLGLAIGVYFVMNRAPKEEEVAGPTAVFLDVPQLAVNLLGEGDEQHFLKLKVALELKNAEVSKQVEVMMPRIQDDYQAFLRQMRVDDLRGSAALARIKDALLLRANQSLSPLRVNNVLFREVLVQ